MHAYVYCIVVPLNSVCKKSLSCLCLICSLSIRLGLNFACIWRFAEVCLVSSLCDSHGQFDYLDNFLHPYLKSGWVDAFCFGVYLQMFNVVWCDILMLLLAQSQIWNDVFLVYILPKLHLKNLHMTHHPWLVLQEKDIFSFLVQMMLSKHRKPCASQKPIHYLLVSFARKGYVSFILFRSSDTVKT